MSENGPREGTRDLPRRDPEAGRRGVDAGSLTGAAYDTHGRQQRRRTRDVLELAREGLSPEEVVRRYGRDHPTERPPTVGEVAEIVAAAGSRSASPQRRRPA